MFLVYAIKKSFDHLKFYNQAPKDCNIYVCLCYFNVCVIFFQAAPLERSNIEWDWAAEWATGSLLKKPSME